MLDSDITRDIIKNKKNSKNYYHTTNKYIKINER